VARNALAHGAKPDPDERVRIALTASEVGRRLPVSGGNTQRPSKGHGLMGSRVLWVDDRPEGNAWARRLLTSFGAEVIPVLGNEEALEEATHAPFDVVVSDIDRGEDEPGTKLGIRLKAAGIDTPIVFFIARLDRTLPLPVGAVHITNDVVEMLACVLAILKPEAIAM